jgi:prepilin-type N-terminal cleavage/methylation domain-containing protein
MRRLRNDQGGFTLIELLVTMSVGMIVMAGILGLLDMTLRGSASSMGRTQAVREGRGAIDRVGQELRLASCPDTGSAVISADADAVSYYVSRPLADYAAAPVVERHTLTYNAANGSITLTVSPGTGIPPVWSGTPSRTSVLGTGLSQTGTTPIFQYLSYDTPTAPDTSLIAAPVAATSLSAIAQVRVTFTALGAYPSANQGSSRFASDVALRTDDPSDEDNTPEC